MSGFFQTREEIESWLNEMGVKDYTINTDLTVDTRGNVDVSQRRIKSFPVRFGKVGGNFVCFNNQLTTLDGAPSSVGGNFNCFDNSLTTLSGAPSWIGCNFYSDLSVNNIRRHVKVIYAEGGQFSAANLISLCAEVQAEVVAELMSSAIGDAAHEPSMTKRKTVRA